MQGSSTMVKSKLVTVLFSPLFFCFISFIAEATYAEAIHNNTNNVATPNKEDWIPDILVPWKKWVLFDKKTAECPFLFNNDQERFCAWPGVLELTVNSTVGASFTQQWHVFGESWISLPGNQQAWPQQVTLNGQPATVLSENERARILLQPGEYQVKGKFLWQKLPSSLSLPQESRLVILKIDGKENEHPVVDETGRLWFSDAVTEVLQNTAEDNIKLRVFRKINDAVPVTIETLITLDISGKPREITIGPALLSQQIPMRVTSDLPVKIDHTGMITLQARAGTANIHLLSRSIEPITTLALPPPAREPVAPSSGDSRRADASPLWPQEELWVFNPDPQLRTVNLAGLASIDPSQTLLPENWQSLQAFRALPNQKLIITTEQRGQTKLQNQLALKRIAWLDASGKGYTLVDKLIGTMQTGWRLEQLPPLALGRIELDNKMQLITQLPNSKGIGIEVRSRDVDITATSRQEDKKGTLPLNGWNVTLNSITTQINLPPAWRILGIVGAENTVGTWWDSWSVFDVFLVFLISIAVAKLSDFRWGIVALLTLLLLHSETDAPKYIWISILLALALGRFFVSGKMYYVITTYKWISFALLFLIGLPFALQQIQTAIYPQTESRFSLQPKPLVLAPTPQENEVAVSSTMMVSGAPKMKDMAVMNAPALPVTPVAISVPIEPYEPQGIIQTGPAIPEWQWNRAQFSNKSVPVVGESVYIFYLSPFMTRLLNIAGVILMVLLGLHLSGYPKDDFRRGSAGSLILTMMGFILFTSSLMPNTVYAEMPSQEILNTLQERLLKPALCVPNCATVSGMLIETDQENLTLTLQMQVGADVAVPIPGDSNWMPQQIIVDGKPAGTITQGQRILLALSAGAHQVVLKGALPEKESVFVSVPLSAQYVDVSPTSQWRVTNVFANLLQGSSLQLIRQNTALNEDSTEEKETCGRNVVCEENRAQQTNNHVEIPPFVRVERHFDIGKKITIETEVWRVAPEQGAINISVPLLPHEQVVETGLSISDNKVNVSLGSDEHRLAWHSTLPDNSNILELSAPKTLDFTEVWQLKVSPLWHLSTTGIPPLANPSWQTSWVPTWQPWPAEKVNAQLLMPKAVSGNTMTIDRLVIHSQIGEREKQAQLRLHLRSSLGGQHIIMIPPEAVVTQVLANRLPVPVHQIKQQVVLPILPGVQEFEIDWREPNHSLSEITTEWVDVGMPSNNTVMSLSLPQNRWVIATGGAQFGPSVMVWALLIGMCVLGWALWRFTEMPLKLYDWIFLALGVSTALPVSILLLAVWLAIFMQRPRWTDHLTRRWFNFVQIVLVIFTIIVFATLIGNLGVGLLADPQMWVQSFQASFINNEEAQYLPFVWYVDHAPNILKQGWVFSLPLWVYRTLMLAWSLWFAFSVIAWLRWGWERFTYKTIWRKKVPS